MTPAELTANILRKRSCLCVGLDTDPARIPAILKNEPDPVFAFNKAILEATGEFAVACKPNLAFYEAMGPAGWESLQKTREVIPADVLSLADAKRGDIGNTATRYADAFFNRWKFDAITVAPYMGRDSVEPFLEFEGKWVFLLGLTSNPGAADFQFLQADGEPLYRHVIKSAVKWAGGKAGHLGFVVGATRAEQISEIRQLAPEAFFLVPGVGAQGGSLEEVMKHGMNAGCGLLINASRSIQYASSGSDFAEAAHREAARLAAEMKEYLAAAGL